MPTAEHWALSGGAYRDENQIILPAIGAEAYVWVPLHYAKDFRLCPRRGMGGAAPGIRILSNVQYWNGDRTVRRKTNAGYDGNGYVPTFVGDGWVPSSTDLQSGFKETAMLWLRCQMTLNAAYGTPGARFIPGPDDLTVIY